MKKKEKPLVRAQKNRHNFVQAQLKNKYIKNKQNFTTYDHDHESFMVNISDFRFKSVGHARFTL